MKKTLLQGTIGIAFGALCLWLALRQISVGQIQGSLQNLDYKWILLAIIFYCINVSVRVVRWRILLRSTIDLSYIQVFAALVVGYMVNSLLPARLGELYRADYMKKKHSIARSSALGSIVIERLLDGLAIVCIFNMGLLVTAIPDENSNILLPIAIISTVVFFLLFLLVRFFALVRPILSNIRLGWLQTRLENFSGTLAVVHQPGFLRPVLITVLIYILEAATLASALKATGIELSLFQYFVVLGAVVLGTLAPTAPGYIGSIQLSFIITLGAFNIEATNAFVAATAYQIFPLMLIVSVGLTIVTFQTYKSVFLRAVQK
jgi:glycosyltransferase 2 family protein